MQLLLDLIIQILSIHQGISRDIFVNDCQVILMFLALFSYSLRKSLTIHLILFLLFNLFLSLKLDHVIKLTLNHPL